MVDGALEIMSGPERSAGYFPLGAGIIPWKLRMRDGCVFTSPNPNASFWWYRQTVARSTSTGVLSVRSLASSIVLVGRVASPLRASATLPPTSPPTPDAMRAARTLTRQGRPRTAREVVRRARASESRAREPARSMSPLTRRARVSSAAATARSLRRRRYALIRVHSMLYRYQTLVSEITFLLFLELINHQKFHTKVSGQHPVAYQPRRPTTNRARFRTQCAAATKEWRGMVWNRRRTGKVMTMRCSSDAHQMRHGAPK